jgi:hypothetical protein
MAVGHPEDTTAMRSITVVAHITPRGRSTVRPDPITVDPDPITVDPDPITAATIPVTTTTVAMTIATMAMTAKTRRKRKIGTGKTKRIRKTRERKRRKSIRRIATTTRQVPRQSPKDEKTGPRGLAKLPSAQRSQ